MDFGLILENWEKKNSRYPDKDRKEGCCSEGRSASLRSISQLKKMEPQAEIDLHGLSAPEAEKALHEFLAGCKSRKLKKVRIIHGKGIHSGGSSVLDKVVDNVLMESPYAGTSGYSKNRDGGTGSRWVILK